MTITYITYNPSKIIEWSGGTSRELYIFPTKSSFKKRDFIFRISTATVDVEESVFTNLPGFKRTLMVLSGSMELMHENHHTIHLNPFEEDVFMGDWNTTSKGKCIDFNLITVPSVIGALSGLSLDVNEDHCVEMDENQNFCIIFVQEGEIKVGEVEFVVTGGVIVISESANSSFKFTAAKKSHVVICKISYQFKGDRFKEV